MYFLITGLLFYCGIAASDGDFWQSRIANYGEIASDGEFPYQVSIQWNVSGSYMHMCGGSLISKRHVLSAAHCFQNDIDSGRFAIPLTVEVGSALIGNGTRYKIQRVSYYAGYTKDWTINLYENDIAIVHLRKPVTISSKVATINLPAPYTPLAATTPVILSGFGSTYYGTPDASGPMSPVLKKMDAVIVSRNECNQYYTERWGKHVGLDKICAKKGPGYGACTGDSGGPLVDSEKKTVIGIVSAGDGECSNGEPDTFTDVSRFISYINEEINYRPGAVNKNPAINVGWSRQNN